MSIRKSIIKAILTLSLVTSIPILSNLSTSHASTSIENELKSVIQKYDENNIQVQEGIALKIGESLDLSKYPNWDLSNNEVAKIENGVLKPIQKGTVFLSQQIGDVAYIVELYVFEEEPVKYISTKENRDYYKVFIDPGHGGSDPGNTTGSTNGRTESVINLQVSNLVKQKLEAQGIEIEMSRTDDTYPTLQERAEMANSYGADIYVSIHQNSAGSITSAHGIETFYHTNKIDYKPLSTDIQNNLIKETDANNRKVKHNDFAVLRLSHMPSTLVECGFMTNPEEYQKLVDPVYQNKLATGISNGIIKYLEENIQLGEEQNPLPVIATGNVINADSLNVRSGPSTSYPIIGKLSRGTGVEIVETPNNWHKIKHNGRYGYVSGSYIQIDSQNPDPQPGIFTDISDHWAKESIVDFANKGYIGGYPDNTFRPSENITRAEFIKIVNKVFGLTEIDEENSPAFSDINKNTWYYNELLIAVTAGYIDGYDDNTFRPDGKITRQEAAKIVGSITSLTGDGELEFIDNDKIDSWAKDYVDALSDNNIMNGYDDNTFKPQNNITRAETVVTLDRINN